MYGTLLFKRLLRASKVSVHSLLRLDLRLQVQAFLDHRLQALKGQEHLAPISYHLGMKRLNLFNLQATKLLTRKLQIDTQWEMELLHILCLLKKTKNYKEGPKLEFQGRNSARAAQQARLIGISYYRILNSQMRSLMNIWM